MLREQFIENNIIRNRESALGLGDALFIRRSRVGRGFGIADLLFLPPRGRHRLVIVEAKQATSPDSRVKVVGQLLMYYAGALQLGGKGLRLLRQFAFEQPRAARSLRPKSLRMLSGGISPPEAAWAELRKGRTLRPSQVAMYVALDSEPDRTLTSALTELAQHHRLSVGVLSVLSRNRIRVWRARGLTSG
jgi:hypothetical protein